MAQRGRPRKNPIPPDDGAEGKKLPAAQNKYAVKLKKTTQEDNEDVLAHCCRVSGITLPHDGEVKEARQQRETFLLYVKDCIEAGMPVTNFGMFAALGISKYQFSMVMGGQTHRELRDLYQEINNFLGMYLEVQTAKGKIAPVTAIFTQKNFFGMKDEQDVILSTKDRFGDAPDGKAIAAKYSDLPE